MPPRGQPLDPRGLAAGLATMSFDDVEIDAVLALVDDDEGKGDADLLPLDPLATDAWPPPPPSSSGDDDDSLFMSGYLAAFASGADVAPGREGGGGVPRQSPLAASATAPHPRRPRPSAPLSSAGTARPRLHLRPLPALHPRAGGAGTRAPRLRHKAATASARKPSAVRWRPRWRRSDAARTRRRRRWRRQGPS